MRLAVIEDQKVECKSLWDVVKQLVGIKKRIEEAPLRKVMESIANTVHLQTVKGFLDSHDPDGHPWAPIKAESRAGWKIYLTHKPLIKTGRLFAGAADATAHPTVTVSGGKATLDIDIAAKTPWYGKFHLTGTKNMPARVWIGISEETAERMSQDFTDTMVGWIATGRLSV